MQSSHDITVQLLMCMSCALTPVIRTAVLQLLAQDPSCKKVLELGAVTLRIIARFTFDSYCSVTAHDSRTFVFDSLLTLQQWHLKCLIRPIITSVTECCGAALHTVWVTNCCMGVSQTVQNGVWAMSWRPLTTISCFPTLIIILIHTIPSSPPDTTLSHCMKW